MTALVTGASGFVGSAVARALVEAGVAVRVLLRPASDRRNVEGLDVEVVEGDMTDPASLAKALKGCDGLYHLAADYRLWAPDPDVLYRVNVEATTDLMRLAAAAGVGRIVYTSSVAALGLTTDGSPTTETTTASLEAMIGHYKRSKYLAELAVRRLIQEEGLPVVIVNPSAPVGPRDVKPTPTGRMIVEAASGAMPAFVDTGLNLAHVDDIAQGHLLAFEKGRLGEGYILAGENMTLAEILGEIARICGRRPPRVKIPHDLLWPLAYAAEGWARLTGAQQEPFITLDGLRMSKKCMYFTHAKAAEELGYRPRPARQGLEDAIAWFRKEGYLS